MNTDYSSPATPLLKRISRFLAAFSFLLPLMVLTGWMADIDFFKRLMTDAPAMNPLSAICFLLLSMSLWLQRHEGTEPRRLRNARLLAIVVAAIGLGKIIAMISNLDYLDKLLFTDRLFDPDLKLLSLMAPNTAACLLLSGLALFLFDKEILNGRRPTQYFSITIMFIAILSLYGYVYGVKFLYGIYHYIPMSLADAFYLLIFAVAVLFSRPEKGTMAIIIGDTSAEITLLRLAAFIIPLVIGWLKLKGEKNGYYNTEYGTALFAIMTYALAMFLLGRRSVVNHKLRMIRKEAQQQLQKSHDRFFKFFNLSPEAKCITAVEDGNILYMNNAFSEMFGLKTEDAIGKTTVELGIISFDAREKIVKQITEEGMTKGMELKLKTGTGEVKDVMINLELIELDDRKCFLTNYLDITKRKKLEDALRESEQLLKAILDSMGEGVEVVDSDGNFILTNPMAEELVGKRVLSNKHAEWIKKGVYYPDGITPFPSEELALHNALKGTPVDNLEFKVQDDKIPEGRSIRCTSRPIRDKADNIIAGVSVMNDITRRKQLEKQLREDEERLRLILHSALNAFIGIDSKGNITDWNRQAEITFGWSREEVIGRKLAETIIPEKYRKTYETGFSHYHETGEWPLLNRRNEIEGLHHSGNEFPIELTITSLKRNNENTFFAFAHDISGRKKQEEEIKQTNYFLNTILENIPDMIFVKDAKELRFVKFNKAGENLLGYSRTDLIGKNDYDFFPKEQADAFTSKDREVISGKVLVDIPEEPIDTKSGKKWLHTQKITITDETGSPLYLMGISEDITEHKLANEALVQSEQLLRAIVNIMVEGVAVCDTSGKFLVYNAKAEEIMGRKPGGVLNHELTTNELFYPDMKTPLPADQTSLKRALKGESTDEMEIFIRNKNIPEGKFLSSTARPVYDENGKLFAGLTMFRDIGKRKHLEKMLKETEERLREVIYTVGEGIVMCDKEGKFILFNKKAEEIIGQGAQDIPPGQWPATYHVYHPDGSRLFDVDELLLMRALRGERVENNRILISNKEKGIEKYLLASSHPVKDANGNITAAIVDFKDVSEIKHLENLLLDIKEKYRQLVNSSGSRSN